MNTTIYGTEIEHNGDVDKGLEYLRNFWNDSYVLDVFENARTSVDRKADFRPNTYVGDGMYVLRFIGPHHYSLEWRD